MVLDSTATRLNGFATLASLALVAALLVLAGCATPVAPPPPETVAPARVEPQAPAAPAPASVTPPAPEAAPPAPAVLSAQELQRTLASAIEHLQGGQEELAESELNKVLQSDPNNRLALSLLRQIKDDPFTALGRESFAYRVLPGETLSRLAQRQLNDLHLFYILARYNNIKVPRNLAGGQMIRLPGRAPAASPAGPMGPTPAPTTSVPGAPANATTAATAGGTVATPATPSGGVPPAASTTAPSAAATEAAIAVRAAKTRADAIARHSRAARAAFAKQDLDAAIRAWDAVLEIEPDNRTALLEKQKVLGLREKLGKVK